MEKMYAKEENAVVLDFLPNGYPFDDRPSHRKSPIAQAIGKTRFVLLELVPKKDVFIQPEEEVYIGDGKRDKIHHIEGKIFYEKLTSTAKTQLEFLIKDIVRNNQKPFLEFFNNSRPLTTRMHQLELLPGLGKKHMWEIIEKREEKEFDSFDDIKKRVKLMPAPEAVIVRRILSEIKGNEKYRLFTEG